MARGTKWKVGDRVLFDKGEGTVSKVVPRGYNVRTPDGLHWFRKGDEIKAAPAKPKPAGMRR
jgi:hypothetical protein